MDLETRFELGLYAVGWLLLTGLATWIARRLDRRGHPLSGTVRALRSLFLPLLFAYLVGRRGLGWSAEPLHESHPDALRVLETLLWLAGIFVTVSLVTNAALLRRRNELGLGARYPKLLVDILRLLLVLLGACFVISSVWNKDLGGLLTALGLSSIVLGLALQNTLDNVMAGIAVLFEQPFQVGDWITVGGITGEVIEMNWRSVRVRTRSRDLIVVPNSVIGKETLSNFSRPTGVHGETHVLGFSYDDPPNKVKRVLLQVVHSTRGVLADPAPSVRTKGYAAYSIEYQIRFFVDDYARVLEINDEFMTRTWYAAKRNGLTIPFPTQTSYEYRQTTAPADPAERPVEMLAKVPVFVPLEPGELESLGQGCERQEFGRGERIVHQGDPGDTLYVVLEGSAVVTVRGEDGTEREVARLSRGEFFGEMALLTGEPRSATVTALDDLTAVVVHKHSLQPVLSRRPGLMQEMAEIVSARLAGLRAVKEQKSAPEERTGAQRSAGALAQRIRRFFGL